MLEIAIPGIGVRGRLLQALLMSFLMGLAAQIEIRLPVSLVPITGQTFAVLLAGALLGSRWGALSVAFYLLEGGIGLPFFAGGAAGFTRFFGPSGGYLIGFLPAAWLTGRLAERGWDRTPLWAAAMMLLGGIPIFAMGLLGLARFVPAAQLLPTGLLPFIPGDILKSLLAAGALPTGWRFLGRK